MHGNVQFGRVQSQKDVDSAEEKDGDDDRKVADQLTQLRREKGAGPWNRVSMLSCTIAR